MTTRMSNPDTLDTRLQLAANALRRGEYASYSGRCRLAVLLEEAVSHMQVREEDHKRWAEASRAALHEAFADTLPVPAGEPVQ